MARKPPSADADFKGDFGWVKRAIPKEQVVAIFDLVGFTTLDSNKDLVSAVRAMETGIELALGDTYYWGERERSDRALESPLNELLLRSTGDGYVIAFSQQDEDLDVLNILVEIYKRIQKSHKVNLGINKGNNYVLMDMNGFVNIIGWGINFAARALQFAQNGQIICTEHFAKPILNTHGDVVTSKNMMSLGNHTVKKSNMEFFNYYKRSEFGAPAVSSQSK